MDEKELKHIFSQNLKSLLQSKNYTQTNFVEDFNKKYGTSFNQTSVSNWVTGYKMPRPIVVEQIGEFFGKDAAYMLSSTPYVDSIQTTVKPSETELEKAFKLSSMEQQAVASRALKSSPDQLEFLNKILDVMFDENPHRYKLLSQYLELLYDDEGEEKK